MSSALNFLSAVYSPLLPSVCLFFFLYSFSFSDFLRPLFLHFFPPGGGFSLYRRFTSQHTCWLSFLATIFLLPLTVQLSPSSFCAFQSSTHSIEPAVSFHFCCETTTNHTIPYATVYSAFLDIPLGPLDL